MAQKLLTQVQCFGASVKGPLHKREGRPNEDAWESYAVVVLVPLL